MATPPARATGSEKAREPVLEVRDLSMSYGSTPAVRKISFDLRSGETLTLLGPSGCGKTTTLRLIAGLEKPQNGEILVNGSVIASTTRGVFVPAERRNMGLVFQSYAVWPHMTVFDNVAYPLRVRRVPKRQIRERATRMLALVGLDGMASRPATNLSGGQQQRLALARSLVYEPDILLLDEPLSNLDAKLRHEMRVEIKRLQGELGTTILFVTHDQLEAMTLSHRIAVMNQGRIEQLDTPQGVFSNPASHFVHGFIGNCVSLPARITTVGSTRIAETGGYGRVRVPEDRPIGEGVEVWVSIGPHDMRVAPDVADPEPDQLIAEVVDVSYVGARYECTLGFGSIEVILTTRPDVALEPGQRVAVDVKPSGIRLWPMDPGAGDTADEAARAREDQLEIMDR